MSNNEDRYLRALEIQELKREIREEELEKQMASLGISTLSQQKFVAESADARRLDRVDTNSKISLIV